MKKPSFKRIAMRCNQEQFDAIKTKLDNLKVYGMSSFDVDGYLVNNAFGKEKQVINFGAYNLKFNNREIHETWNEKIFLEACGIEVEEPKEETFVISKEQIETIYEDGCTYIKEWFPKAFEPEKKELVAGKWYVYPASPKFITFVKENGRRYGIGITGHWFNDSDVIEDTRGYREASPEEVKESLTKEAIKRGYVEGVWLKKTGSNKHMDQKLKICGNFDWFPSLNILDDQLGNGHIFDNGIWSEIIPTITKSEAEKKLNCKII